MARTPRLPDARGCRSSESESASTPGAPSAHPGLDLRQGSIAGFVAGEPGPRAQGDPVAKLFEPLESRILLSGTPLPDATVQVPAKAFIGEHVNVTVAFDNIATGDNHGFGPY